MDIEYNPDGGALGRSDRPLAKTEVYIIVPHVAECLQGFFNIRPGNYKYAFEVICRPNETEEFKQALNLAKLPKDVNWYRTPDGQMLFELRSSSGGVTNGHLICYLVTTSF